MKIFLLPGAVQPMYETYGAAGFDLHAYLPPEVGDQYLASGDTKMIPTGLYVEIPQGYVGLVCSRSGLAMKKSVHVLNAPGVIDSDYRGQVGVILHNASNAFEPFMVEHGDRIAQMLIVPVTQVRFEVCQSPAELSSTARGSGGFGSTGVAHRDVELFQALSLDP